MPKDYLREFDEFLKTDAAWYQNLGQPNWDAIKSFLSEAIKASKQEGANGAVDFIEKNSDPQMGVAQWVLDFARDYENPVKEEKV